MARDPKDPGTHEMKLTNAKRRKVTPVASKTLRIGYARKSKDEQELALQVDALERAGCSKIYVEQISRAGPRRQKKGAVELEHALMALRPGDTLVVWRLDRLAGSVSELIRIVTTDLKDRGIGFESLMEKIDTSTAAGNMFFQIAAVFAEYERNVLIERTHAGLKAARARGRKGGRRQKLSDSKVRELQVLAQDGSIPLAKIARDNGIGRTTLYNYLQRRDQ